ncbi:MAG TPA: hypothetical protein VK049_07710 [Paenalcaligenes sp.]|nr:hypothetical protein [Paenalcaligenes sp.]
MFSPNERQNSLSMQVEQRMESEVTGIFLCIDISNLLRGTCADARNRSSYCK